MNYELFLNDLISGYVSKLRNNVINYIYDTLLKRAKNFQREIDVQFLKEEYNAINNYFIKEESENRNDYEECLETFHYSFNGVKEEKIEKREFMLIIKILKILIKG